MANDGMINECYELTKNNQFIDRPFEPGTEDVMEAVDTLGACLGF